jgi:beta-glucosidase-like glycosyl hydrolase
MTSGRLLMPALRWREGNGFSHEEATIAAALELGVGGFVLFGGTVEDVRNLTRSLRQRAARPLLIGSDLERGAGQQVRGLAELPPPRALAALGEQSVIRGAGLLTAVEALEVGINWVFAPDADLDIEPVNPIVQTRSFGQDPAKVAECVASWIAGCEVGGALACAKHFPGHGRTRVDSHDAIPVVDATLEELRSNDLVPFAAAIDAGVSSIMTAHVAFPALDPTGTPATRSEPILRLLREEMEFGGLIVSDALTMAGALTGGPGVAAVAAVTAGVDVLLDPSDPAAMAAALDAEASRTPALRERLEASLARVDAAAAGAETDAGEFVASHGSAPALADWLLSRPLARGVAPRISAPLELFVLDDDLEGKWPPSTPSDILAAELRQLGVPLAPGGSPIVVVLAEPRASKGRAGLGSRVKEALRASVPDARLVILFGHPRLVDEIPAGPPVLLAWHRQGLMQASAARWLAERLA